MANLNWKQLARIQKSINGIANEVVILSALLLEVEDRDTQLLLANDLREVITAAQKLDETFKTIVSQS